MLHLDCQTTLAQPLQAVAGEWREANDTRESVREQDK